MTSVQSGKDETFMSAVHVFLFLKTVHIFHWYRSSQKKHREQKPIKHILSSLKNVQNMAVLKCDIYRRQSHLIQYPVLLLFV